jgi:hypothetical protein
MTRSVGTFFKRFRPVSTPRHARAVSFRTGKAFQGGDGSGVASGADFRPSDIKKTLHTPPENDIFTEISFNLHSQKGEKP